MTINGVSVVDFAAVLLGTGLLRAVPLVVAGIGELPGPTDLGLGVPGYGFGRMRLRLSES